MLKNHVIPFSALLPQKTDALLSDPQQKSQILNVLKQLHIVMVEALTAFFLEDNLHLFDPHVGETCCQVRAYYLIRLFKSRHKIYQNKQECLNYITQLEAQRLWIHKQMLAEGNKQKSQRDKVTLTKFLSVLECDFNIPCEELAYLCSALLLSEYSYFNEVGVTGIDYKKLMLDWTVSKRLAHNVVRMCQRLMAKATCDYLYKLCKVTPSLKALDQILPALQQSDDDKRSVLPYYFGAKVLVEHMKVTRQLILLQAERRTNKHLETVCLLFKFCEKSGEYRLVPISTVSPSEECFVIHGITGYENHKMCESRNDYILRLEKVGIETLFLASMASHVQFVGKKLHSFRQIPMTQNQLKNSAFNVPNKEFLDMKRVADRYGCSLSAANLMVVRHVYCDILSNQFELAEFVYNTVRRVVQLKESVSQCN